MSVPLSAGSIAGPAAPTNLRIEKLTATSVALAWDPSTDYYTKHYHIYISTDDSSFEHIASTSKPYHRDKIITDDSTTYYYKISVEDIWDIESDLTSSVNSAVAAPAAPTGLIIERTSGRQISLSWDASTDTYFKNYRIERSSDAGLNYYTIAAKLENTFFTDINLSPATWIYRIVAVDKFNTPSTASSTVTHQIKALIPFKDTFTITAIITPVIKDIETALGRKATEGTIICLGPGRIQLELSYDGTNYDTPMWIRQQDYYNISSKKNFMEISKIRFTTDVNATDATISVI